jgi:DNA-binding NtrC family response regulator
MRSRKTLRILVVAGEQGSRDEIRAIVSAIPNVVCSMANSISRTDRREDTAEHDILLLDIRGSEPAFLAPLRELRARGDATPCVVICDPTGPEIVREVLRHGAQDVVFASEVTSGEALLGVLEAQRVRTALTARTMRRESSRCAQPAQDAAAVRGQSDAMRQVREVMSQVAGADSPVLICGESGAGKGLVAHTLHEMGRRCAAPFITVNCDALPLSLAESKLFGHERGAFTGAHLRARGLLEMAGAGTLLLDEVADLPLEVQPKLLQALEERRFRPVGAEYEVPFLARVLASTSGDLEARVRSGHFRLDLYYRLAVVVLRLPSLEARADDIPELVAALVEGRPRALRFTPEALAWLMARPWPGNVRELRNVVERLGLVAGSEPVDVRTLEQVAGGGPDRKDSVMERPSGTAGP